VRRNDFSPRRRRLGALSERQPYTALWVDADTGERLAFESQTSMALGNHHHDTPLPAHGSIGPYGYWYRSFVSVMGLFVVGFSVTGVWIRWRKRSQRFRAGG